MIIMIEIVLQLIGFSLLSLSMSRHYSHVVNRRQRIPKITMWLLRVVGYGMLLTAVILAINSWGMALGLVYCFATATLVTILLALLLTYKPYWLSFIPSIVNKIVTL